MVITGPDYDKVEDFRTILYRRLSEFLQSKTVVIIGNSLEDPDLRKLVDDAVSAKSKDGAPGKIFLFVYTRNDDLGEIYESRGVTVCFGGIDEFFHSILKEAPSNQLVLSLGEDILTVAPTLQPSTISVRSELRNRQSNLNRMFNGKPATYGDIERGWVFEREIVSLLESQFVSSDGRPYAVLLGAAGVGKTTATRTVLRLLENRGITCWEHKGDFDLDDDAWIKVNSELSKRKEIGVLFVDNAHHQLRSINRLVERLAGSEEQCLGIIFVSSKPHWNPRIKSSFIFSHGTFYELSKLSDVELGFLLDLLDSVADIRALVEAKFLGYNRTQRLDRLRQRCDADMFVCLKNIFGFQSIDGIILEEFNSLSEDLQGVYRYVAGMQSIGVRVHRESIRRITGLQANYVERTLEDLDGIIEEYVVSEKLGIYGWNLRHHLIAMIISRYKFSSQEDIYELFDLVISRLKPAYQLEVQSISDMCDLDTGITRIIDQEKQNVLLRKMINLAPRERIPRHRLIYNLISLGQYDTAESEIRIFEKELRPDAPLLRYQSRLKLGIARNMPGLANEDRAYLVREAIAVAESALRKYSDDKNIYRNLLDCGVEYFRYTGSPEPFERAMALAIEAQTRILDPDLRAIISKYTKTSEEMGFRIAEAI